MPKYKYNPFILIFPLLILFLLFFLLQQTFNINLSFSCERILCEKIHDIIFLMFIFGWLFQQSTVFALKKFEEMLMNNRK